MRNAIRAGGALALDRRLDRRLVYHQYLGRHARQRPRRRNGLRTGAAGAGIDRARRPRRAAHRRRKTSTISSSRRATPKAPTGSSKWIYCGVTCAANSPKSSAPPPCKRTKRRAPFRFARWSTDSGTRWTRTSARFWVLFPTASTPRWTASRCRSSSECSPTNRAPWTPGRFAGRFDGDGARSHRRLERNRAPRPSLPQGRLSRTGRAFSVYRSVLRRAGHRRARRDGTGARVHEALRAARRTRRHAPPARQQRMGRRAPDTRAPDARCSRTIRTWGCAFRASGICSTCARPDFMQPARRFPARPESFSGITIGSLGPPPTERSRRYRFSTRLQIWTLPPGRAKRFTFACTPTRRSDTIAGAASSGSRPTTAASSWCAGMRINAPSRRYRHFSASIARRRWKTRSRRSPDIPGRRKTSRSPRPADAPPIS